MSKNKTIENNSEPGEIRFKRLGDIAREVMHREYALTDSDKDLEVGCGGSDKMMKSGYPELDKMLGSFVEGALYVIGGRPAVGKTALMLDITTKVVASTPKLVYILSLEMTAEELTQRMISMIVNLDQKTVRGGNLTDYQKNLICLCWCIMDAMPIYICDAAASMEQIESVVREEISDGILLIDCLQLIDAGGEHSKRSMIQSRDEISPALKALATEKNVPIVVCSQLTQGSDQRENKRPQLSDFRDNERIVQDADGIILIHRDPNNAGDKAELILAKNRFGETGSAYIRFDNDKWSFNYL